MKGFSTFYPVVLVTYLLSIAGFSMFINNPILLLISLIFGMGFFAVLTSLKKMLKNLLLLAPLIFIVTVMNPLISHKGVTVLLFINNNPITLEAIIYGFGMGLMLSSVIVWFKCFNTVVTSDKLTFVLGKFIPKLSLIISISLHFIPLFLSKGKEIRVTQKAMGIYKGTTIWCKIKGELSVVSALITWALENSVETSMSMQARGYGLKNRTTYSDYKMRKRDIILLLSNVILIVTIIACQFNNKTIFCYYPEIIVPNVTPLVALNYLSYTILMAIPVIIEIKEDVKWNYLISKI